MKYRVSHTTRYQYQKPVSQCHSVAHLLPRSTPWQVCTSASVDVNPVPASATERGDYFGNRSYHFSVQVPHETLEITAVSEVDVFDRRQTLALDFGASCADVLEQLKHSRLEDVVLAREYTLESPMVKLNEELRDYAADCFADELPFFSCVHALTQRIFTDFAYDPHYTNVATPLEEVIRHRRGVCQDFAHLAIGALRALGYPARYVSGYLETQPPPGEPKLQGTDASHAWFSAFSPAEGWGDFDPTNNQPAAAHHITTAWGRDYSDVVPMKGTILGGGAGHELAVAVDVTRLEDAAS